MCLCIRLTANGEIESFQVKNRSVTEEKKRLVFWNFKNQEMNQEERNHNELSNCIIFLYLNETVSMWY